MIRPTGKDDVPILIEMARDTGVFKPGEVTTLEEVLADYLRQPGGDDYHCYSFERNDEVAGFVAYGPNTMTDRTWELYWIVVAENAQGCGIGGELLRAVEADVRRRNGRLLVVETSSLPSYDSTRRFYQKHGYEQAAVVKDFYADGDSLVLFCKRLSG